MTNKKISTLEIMTKGFLWVNLPIVIIIITFWYSLSTFLSLNNSLSILVGAVLGWIYWEYSVKKWVRWAVDSNVNPDRLLKIGQISLLLWNRSTIDKVLNEKK